MVPPWVSTLLPHSIPWSECRLPTSTCERAMSVAMHIITAAPFRLALLFSFRLFSYEGKMYNSTGSVSSTTRHDTTPSLWREVSYPICYTLYRIIPHRSEPNCVWCVAPDRYKSRPHTFQPHHHASYSRKSMRTLTRSAKLANRFRQKNIRLS